MNYLKKTVPFVLFFLAFHCVHLSAQNSLEQAIVYYKDGSVFIGEILEEKFDRLQLIISSGDTITVYKNAAQRIRKTRDQIQLWPRGKYHYTKGYFGGLSLGIGIRDDSDVSSIDLILGKRLNERFSVGLNLGYTNLFSEVNFSNFWLDHYFYNIGPYGRYYLGGKRGRTFVSLSAGYGFKAEDDFFLFADDYRGGPFVKPGFGVHLASRNKFRWLFSISQSFQRATGQGNQNDIFNNSVLYNYKIWHNSLLLTIGLEFR